MESTGAPDVESGGGSDPQTERPKALASGHFPEPALLPASKARVHDIAVCGVMRNDTASLAAMITAVP